MLVSIFLLEWHKISAGVFVHLMQNEIPAHFRCVIFQMFHPDIEVTSSHNSLYLLS